MEAIGVIVGMHLVEPFISLTTSTKTTRSKLEVAFKQLYTDLAETPSTKLLDLASPAFKFISKERFDSVKYADNIVEETKQVIAAHRASVLKGIDIILPRLKDGWVTQRGDIYQFGPSPSQEEPNRIDLMNPTKLANAPINNMAPERQVGFVQYELKIRGAKQLNAASSAQVKGKSI